MRRKRVFHAVLGFASLALLTLAGGRLTADPVGSGSTLKSRPGRLAVHEWGTFTSLQDETGQAVMGINTDDEPLPRFVHRLADWLVPEPTELAPIYYKGVPRIHRDVALRLETPVIYFHPPKSWKRPLSLDVRVAFRGGWLTEYYPNAAVDAPGLDAGTFDFGKITPETVGSLTWKGLQVGAAGEVPKTDYHVWLAPRQVDAAPVRNSAGESEKYLFYRGVGNLAAPLRVVRDEGGGKLSILEQTAPLNARGPLPLRAMWLVHVRPDKTVAYRSLGRAELRGQRERLVAVTPAEFAETDHSQENLRELETEMHAALVAEGLFDDEARAMLATWQLGYFKSPGLRLFFLLPQAWTDAVMPLTISAPADITRVMVGRIEIVTPEQRQALSRIADGPAAPINWLQQALGEWSGHEEAYRKLWEGSVRISDLNLPVPADYQAYVDLGRFRNALLLDACYRRQERGLRRFIEDYNLSYAGEGK